MDQETQGSFDNSLTCKHLLPFFKGYKLYPGWMPTPTGYMQNFFPFFQRLLPWRILICSLPKPSPLSVGLSGRSTYVVAFFMATFGRSCFYCRERAEQRQNELDRIEKDAQHKRDLEKQYKFEKQYKDAEQRCKSLQEELDQREQDIQSGKNAEKRLDELKGLNKDTEQRCKTLEERLNRQKQDIERGKDAEDRLNELDGLNQDTEQRCKTLEEQLDRQKQDIQRGKDAEDQLGVLEWLNKDAEQRCKTLEEQLDRQKQDIQRGKDAEDRLRVLEGLNKDVEQLCKFLQEERQRYRNDNERLHSKLGCLPMRTTIDRVKDISYCETEISKMRSKLQKLLDDLKKLKPTKKFIKLLTQLRLDAEEQVRFVTEHEKDTRAGKMLSYAKLDKDLIDCDEEKSLIMGLAIQRSVQFFVLTREEDLECIPCVQWKTTGLVSGGVKRALDNFELAGGLAALNDDELSTKGIKSEPTGQT